MNVVVSLCRLLVLHGLFSVETTVEAILASQALCPAFVCLDNVTVLCNRLQRTSRAVCGGRAVGSLAEGLLSSRGPHRW